MGRAESEMFISTNGYISFSNTLLTKGNKKAQAGTAPIPSQAAHPDDAIFVYWTDLDFSACGTKKTDACRIYATSVRGPHPCTHENLPAKGSYRGGRQDTSDSIYFATLTITWLNAPYRGSKSGATASFQATLYPDGAIKMQYLKAFNKLAPAWAPVSIGLEGLSGFDGIQVAFDNTNFPRSGTALGFAKSCGSAGENSCDIGDLHRVTASAWSDTFGQGSVSRSQWIAHDIVIYPIRCSET